MGWRLRSGMRKKGAGDPETYVDVFIQELVSRLVFADEVRVDSATSENGAEEEAKEPASVVSC